MACTDSVSVRSFQAEDAPQLLRLMQRLAKFEDYIDEFRVSEQDLINYGLSESPLFNAYVASLNGSAAPCAMAVIYTIPWTYDLQPTLVLKELYVEPEARGHGVAGKLLARVANHAIAIGAPRLHWTVLPGNTRAVHFYQKLGATADTKWAPWHLQGLALQKLASTDTVLNTKQSAV